MKIKAADRWFSKCVRERAFWRCERCGKYYAPRNTRGLDCSHFIGRGNWSVRFDPDNAFAHCVGCHSYFENNPHEFVAWAYERLNGRYAGVLARSKDISIAKRAHRAVGEIAAHYKAEYERMTGLRESAPLWGAARIEFENWE
jgi:hypothetical protein